MPVVFLDQPWQIILNPELLIIIQESICVLSDSDQWHRVLPQGEAKQIHFHITLVLRVVSNIQQLLLHLVVGRRDGVREPNLVFFVGSEFVSEAQCEVSFHAFACSVVVENELVGCHVFILAVVAVDDIFS